MTTNAPLPDPEAATAPPQRGGILGWLGVTAGKTFVESLFSHIWGMLIVFLSPLAGYLALWQADVAPSPSEIAGRLSGQPRQPLMPTRSAGIAEVVAQGEGASGDKARAVQVRVTESLRAMPAGFGGIKVRYALGPIRSGNGATSATSVRWALKSDTGNWLICPDIPLSFTSERGLADAIAKRINNSLLASETGGQLQCG
ncbi:hypothetical protein [Erythrobacter donghaensis]|uniref:hypothetical protein n=1 Tax=Erythrobacter donghaensis TaxID=267135 RepID=UPI000A3B6E59|nr:hypothetical protein [Erythrobacter donghaensis]